MASFTRYPYDFAADTPSVDYLKIEFCRRDYTQTDVVYKKEGDLTPIIINIPQKVTEAMSQNYANAQMGEVGRFFANKGELAQSATDSETT